MSRRQTSQQPGSARADRGRRRRPARPASSSVAGSPPIVGFVSLGCSKNLVDSEMMLAQIAESGAIITSDESIADTIVVNTCGFLEASRDEALDVLRELVERKARGTLKRIVVAGCLVQRDGTRLTDEVPEIDALVGVHNRDDVPAAVWGRAPSATVAATPTPVPATASGTSRGLPILAGGKARGARARRPQPQLHLGTYHPQSWNDRGRLRLTPRHYAYMRISEGCDQKCTFCTIPSIRGPMRCKTPDELVAEGRELIADGARELILIGQDTTSYGRDLGYGAGLAGLLRHLDRHMDGADWIRLMYVYPSVFTDEMIDAIASCQRVVKYIDIPLQHASDRMLRAMGRRVTRRAQEALLERIRARIPGVTIRTTFIVGFPGETEADFAELLDLVESFRFDAVGAFRYSLEPETPSGRMKDQVVAAVKEERYERLMLTQQKTAFARARERVGSRFDVVVDGPGADGACLGRHAGQAPEVDGACRLPDDGFVSGQVLHVRCTGADGYDLLVKPARRALPLA